MPDLAHDTRQMSATYRSYEFVVPRPQSSSAMMGSFVVRHPARSTGYPAWTIDQVILAEAFTTEQPHHSESDVLAAVFGVESWDLGVTSSAAVERQGNMLYPRLLR